MHPYTVLATQEDVLVEAPRLLYTERLGNWRESDVLFSSRRHQEGLSVLRLICHQLEDVLRYLRYTENKKGSSDSNVVNRTHLNLL